MQTSVDMQVPDPGSTTWQPLHPLVGRVLHDRYQLCEFVGTGGMASVFRAHDSVLERMVAVKVLHPKLASDAEFVARFAREAEFAAGVCGHPNIVSIYDVGTDENLHYIVMEFAEGRTLRDVIAHESPLPVERALGIAAQIADGLVFAHEHGLVHRDIKPQNILLLPGDHVKVADFGIAWNPTSTPMTRVGVVMGTTHYLAPELALGKPASAASDLYALGVVLYEMLTGRVPFDGDDRFAVAMKHVHEDPTPPEQLNPAIPGPLSALILRTLRKSPDERYANARALLDALRQALSYDTLPTMIGAHPLIVERRRLDTPTAALPHHVLPAHPIHRPPRRATGLFPLLLVLLLCIPAGIAAATWLMPPIHAVPGRIIRHPSPVTHPAGHPLSCGAGTAANLALTTFTVSQSTVRPGSTVPITYTVRNASGGCRRVFLGASAISDTIRGQAYSSPGRIVAVGRGVHTYTVGLYVPTSAVPQTFSLQVTASAYRGPRFGTLTSVPGLIQVTGG